MEIVALKKCYLKFLKRNSKCSRYSPSSASKNTLRLLEYDFWKLKFKGWKMEEIFQLEIQENMEKQFKNIANILMNNYDLDINGQKFQFIDIEFYLKNNIHNDTYTHCNERQRTRFQWYLHRQCSERNSSIKQGNRKGLDFTFGNDDYCAGMLIRAIRNNKNSTLSTGPSLSVGIIMDIFNIKNIDDLSELVEDKNYLDTKLQIVKKEKPTDSFIYYGTRQGLNCQKDDKYFKKHYRFIIVDNKTQGIKNKISLLKNAIKERTIEQIQKDVGYKINLNL